MSKDYKKWSELKTKINNTQLHQNFHVHEGEVWWCVFGENIGIEIDGKGEDYLRPALVIKVFNKYHTWVVPITSHIIENDFHTKVTLFSNVSSASTSQLRTISSNRLFKFICIVNINEFEIVRKSIIKFLEKEIPAQSGEISRPLGNNDISVADDNNLSTDGGDNNETTIL